MYLVGTWEMYGRVSEVDVDLVMGDDGVGKGRTKEEWERASGVS